MKIILLRATLKIEIKIYGDTNYNFVLYSPVTYCYWYLEVEIFCRIIL